MRRAAVLASIAGALLAAQWFYAMAQTTEFSDHTGAGTTSESALMPFDEWSSRQPIEKKFLALFPNYVEPLVNTEASKGETGQKPEKLYMYVAQARFVLAKA